MNQLIKDMRLVMEIAPDGVKAKGLMGGYYGVEQLMFYIGGIGPIHSSGQADCPSIYHAAWELADGYPDPKTGRCSALSSAFTFEAVSAFIVHPDGTQQAGDGPLQRLKNYLSSLFASNGAGNR
jgi:hypothetical protein